jgi:AAA family ATPase
MMARALASEAKASFLARSATTLIGIHVGDGAKKIHDLYEAAAAVSPVIVFIDELDAIGLSRSFQSVRGDVIEVATALLAELGGMEENKGVVTIGATNQANMLDPALRSRFEEEIMFDIPTLDDRIAMIEAFAKSTPVKVKMDYRAVATRLDKWTGRDLKEKLFKVLIHDAILEKKEITTEDALALVAKIMKKDQGSRYNPLAI